jgi:hypothetical protein
MIRTAHVIARSLQLASAGVSLLLLAMPASAAASFKDWKPGAPCFARSYDAKHLAAHPKQRLTHFALSASSLGAPVPKGSFEITLSFRVKGGSEAYRSEAICHGGPSSATCGLEGDGGEFTMKSDGSSLVLTISRIMVEGEKVDSPEIGVGGDDRLVRLYPGPSSACRFD